MRAALKSKSARRSRLSMVQPMPAPIGGWNARDALASMLPTDAVALDNFMPKASYVELRDGYTSHVSSGTVLILTESGSDVATESGDVLVTESTSTSIAGTIKTLPVYNGMTGVNQMFAITESGVYNVSTAGDAGSSLIARTNGKHQWTMYGDGTTNWLIAVNGTDNPLYYDGTTWTAITHLTSPALTGFPADDLTQLIGLNVYKRRLFFIPKNSLSFWYLAAGAAGGGLTEFDLSAEATRGGYLMAMGTWTRDAGDGQDDVAVFVTSEGEAIVYQGTNPSDANAWSKVGTFFIGRPLGRRCLTQYGGDVLVLTENGVFPLSAGLPSANVDYRYALSDKIQNAFTDSARSNGMVFGWEATVYPGQQALLVNVPVAEDGIHYQYVMNTFTKSWCRFLAWNAETFVVYNRELYFASGSTVAKAWTGAMDGTDNIEAYGKQAFSQFGQPNHLKTFKLFRPVLSTNGTLDYLTDIDVDFQDDPMTGVIASGATAAATWDVSQWDGANWAGGLNIVKQWTSVSEWPGFWASGKLKVVTNSVSVQWMSSDYAFETGDVL